MCSYCSIKKKKTTIFLKEYHIVEVFLFFYSIVKEYLFIIIAWKIANIIFSAIYIKYPAKCNSIMYKAFKEATLLVSKTVSRISLYFLYMCYYLPKQLVLLQFPYASKKQIFSTKIIRMFPSLL